LSSTINPNAGTGAAAPMAQLTAYQRWELDSFDAPKEVPFGGAPKEVPLGGGLKQGRKTATLPTVDQMLRMQQQAQQEGYAAGYREGGERAAAEAARLQQIMGTLAEESQQFDQHLADELLALAMAISKQVMRQALKLRPELILAVINEVLGQLPQTQQRVQIALHPEDAALVRARMGEQIARSGWEIIEDAGLQRGGCHLHTPECDIDATLERRWQRVVAAIGDEHGWLD
jgi:flagellar assembly protein FliH